MTSDKDDSDQSTGIGTGEDVGKAGSLITADENVI